MNLKNKKVYITSLVIILVIISISIIVILKNKEEIFEDDISSFSNELKDIGINEFLVEDVISEKENSKVNEVKTNYGMTGDTELYEVQKGTDNVEIPIIKPSIKYKVAFAGMIKNKKPEFSELDNIIRDNHPKYAGIYIEANSREKFMNLLSQNTKSTYKIDENGYLQVEDNNERNDKDKIIQKSIMSKKLYIIDFSSICYIVDDVTGEILDYNFEKLDRYQTYEYFNDKDMYIMFVTENTNNLLTKEEIFESLVKFMS